MSWNLKVFHCRDNKVDYDTVLYINNKTLHSTVYLKAQDEEARKETTKLICSMGSSETRNWFISICVLGEGITAALSGEQLPYQENNFENVIMELKKNVSALQTNLVRNKSNVFDCW